MFSVLHYGPLKSHGDSSEVLTASSAKQFGQHTNMTPLWKALPGPSTNLPAPAPTCQPQHQPASPSTNLPGPSTNPARSQHQPARPQHQPTSSSTNLPRPRTNPARSQHQPARPQHQPTRPQHQPCQDPAPTLPNPSTNPAWPGPSTNPAWLGPSTIPALHSMSSDTDLPSSYASTSSPLPSNAIASCGLPTPEDI
ncbi:swi5-dependent recombination DNA repair protein 1 homolog [Oncorhynchus mykiss]|uniref:swi5-dependent recombination DNA repair protein 1 homolog n=1 Tax=Oncorhynchus mykiss TaxID=8022 RepID=UPI00187782CD|nr:swi5-dependent recombination DNA repair protein 1 homolog [Oncorhynchus mykiss]